MVDTIRQIAADLHAAAESLRAIEVTLDIILWVCVGGFAAVFGAVSVVAVRGQR